MIEQGFCPRCGRPNCTTHPQKGTAMTEVTFTFGGDHEATIKNLQRIIELNREIGNLACVEIYEDALAKYTGEHPSKLF